MCPSIARDLPNKYDCIMGNSRSSMQHLRHTLSERMRDSTRMRVHVEGFFITNDRNFRRLINDVL